MRLEMAILAGDESKRFLASLTEQIDRLEKLVGKIDGKKADTKPAAEEPDEETEKDEDDDEDFAAKPTKGKAKSKSFDEEGDDEAEGDEDADGDEEPEADEDEDEKPAKKAKGKAAKKYTADDVNDACKKHAKANGREATLKILTKKFKVQSVTELKPEQYADVIKAVAIEDEE